MIRRIFRRAFRDAFRRGQESINVRVTMHTPSGDRDVISMHGGVFAATQGMRAGIPLSQEFVGNMTLTVKVDPLDE